MIDLTNDGTKGYIEKTGLENLLRRLEKGMKLRGRIVDKFDANRYLLRIWGYNLLTQSMKEFEKFEEVDLLVLQVTPHLVLDIFKTGAEQENHNDGIDIIIR